MICKLSKYFKCYPFGDRFSPVARLLMHNYLPSKLLAVTLLMVCAIPFLSNALLLLSLFPSLFSLLAPPPPFFVLSTPYCLPPPHYFFLSLSLIWISLPSHQLQFFMPFLMLANYFLLSSYGDVTL